MQAQPPSVANTIRADNRDVLYKLLSPLLEKIARGVPASVSPNTLTALGLLCVGVGVVLLGSAASGDAAAPSCGTGSRG